MDDMEFEIVKEPIFLIGSERSGTTLLRLMLDGHPDIAFNFESEYMVARIGQDGRPPEMAAYRDWLSRDRVFMGTGFEIPPDLGYLDTMNHFLCQKRHRDGKRLVGATVHRGFRHLTSMWPEARFIYLFRDGRDVANSVLSMNAGWTGNVYMAANWWVETEHEWDTVRPTLDPDRWIEVRYEDLVHSVTETLGRICDFVGVRYDDAMLSYARSTTYGLPDPSLTQQWKRKLKTRDLRLLEAKIGSRLVRRGYELSGHPPLAVTALHEAFLAAQSRVLRYHQRLRAYGLWLPLAETLTRRLGLESAHRAVMRRINRISETLVK